MLDKARSKVDFAIAEQVYMLPSDMLLKIGTIKGYNNNLLITNESVKIGIINQSVNITPKHVFHKPPVDLPKHIPKILPHETTTTLSEHEKNKRKIISKSWRP